MCWEDSRRRHLTGPWTVISTGARGRKEMWKWAARVQRISQKKLELVWVSEDWGSVTVTAQFQDAPASGMKTSKTSGHCHCLLSTKTDGEKGRFSQRHSSLPSLDGSFTKPRKKTDLGDYVFARPERRKLIKVTCSADPFSLMFSWDAYIDKYTNFMKISSTWFQSKGVCISINSKPSQHFKWMHTKILTINSHKIQETIYSAKYMEISNV